MTETEFRSNDSCTHRMNEILNDPVFLQARLILKTKSKPAFPSATGGDLLHQAALNGASAYGWMDCLDTLEKLANPLADRKSPPRSETPNHDRTAIEAMMKKGYTREQAEQAAKQSLAEQTQKL